MTHLQDYDEWLVTHRSYVGELRGRVIDELDDAGLVYDQVTIRVKDRDSFAQKVASSAIPEYCDFDSAYDIVGLRVITYHSSQIPQLVEALSNLFEVERVIDKAAETAREGRFGYASQHLIVRDGQQLIEIQLRTVLQHAWAEFEHDIRYKNSEQVDPQISRAFTLAAGLIELADQQFDTIASIVEKTVEERDDRRIEASHLPMLMSRLVGEKYPTSKVEYYIFAVKMLQAHGITQVRELKKLLASDKLRQLDRAMNYKFHPGQVRLIDDMLLFTYGREHIQKTVHIEQNSSTRPGRLKARWQQLGGSKP